MQVTERNENRREKVEMRINTKELQYPKTVTQFEACLRFDLEVEAGAE